MISYGAICEVKKGYAKVQLRADDIVTDWLPVLVGKSKTDKESWQLEIGEQVVCLMDEQCETGVILGAIPSDTDAPDSGEAPGKFRKLFSDGTLIEYDKNMHEMTINVQGTLKALASVKAEVSAPIIECTAIVSASIIAPLINLQGNAAVTGALTAASIATTGGGPITGSGDIETTGQIKGGTVVAGVIDLATHKHTHGSGGGTTSVPIP